MNPNDIDNFIIQWNRKFPMDRLWRQKYKVPFLSSTHRECSFIDQLIDLREESLFLSSKEENNDDIDVYIPNVGDIFKTHTNEKKSNEISDQDIEEFREQSKMFE